jgi:hypothetical protein
MNNLVTELQSAKAGLTEVIVAIPDEQFNKVPFEDSWTAAQVSEHIFKALGVEVLYGATKPTDRVPDEKVAEVMIFLDFTIKMKSPDFILPSDEPQDKAPLLNGLEDKLNKLIEAAQTLDLTLTCLDFEIPEIGAFTRLEFLWFYVFHTKRHIHQLQNITKALA